ncbi:MAG: hypothetical protein HY816_18575 [Candidatus Wallbacteria bacterium]|nr:hypothetical protein [Candidatus Wallbacteria bacterium]
MNCLDAREMFAELLAEELQPAAAERLTAHVAACGACADELDLLRAAVAEIGQLPVHAAPPELADAVMGKLASGPGWFERLRESWGTAALAAAGAGAIAAGAFMPGASSPPPAGLPAAGQPVSPAAASAPEGERSAARSLAPTVPESAAVAAGPSSEPARAERRIGPGAGPRIEALQGSREGRPVEPAAGTADLERPLDGPKD